MYAGGSFVYSRVKSPGLEKALRLSSSLKSSLFGQVALAETGKSLSRDIALSKGTWPELRVAPIPSSG